MDVVALRPFVEAAALGLGVGLEREWSNRSGEQQSAGSRTFAVLGLAGAVAAALGTSVVAAGALAVAIVLAAGYTRTASKDRGTTTELAAFATYLLGALAHRDAELAVGLAVAMAALLAAKGPIHRLAREILTETEVTDALRFFVVAFVVLPLLPDRDAGPYGALNPARIWLLVVAVSGIGWAGYIAVRALGPRRGLLVTGLAGGFVSATATTASLGRLSRRNPDVASEAVAGALLASAATFVQLGLVIAVANPNLLTTLGPALVAGLVAFACQAAVLYRHATTDGAAHDDDSAKEARRPFALWPAIALAGILTVVLLAARWAADVAGPGGAVMTSGAAGFADVHSAVLAVATLARDGSLSLQATTAAAGAALATNTISKCVVAFVAGGSHFGARFAELVAIPAVAVAVALLVTLR